MSTFPDQLIPHHIRDIPVYQPGKPVAELERELGISEAVKLASNENPLGPSARAVEAATRALAEGHLYPEGGSFYLRQALAKRLGVNPDQLIFGGGCNEVIHLIIRSLCRPTVDEVLTHKYTFVSYRLAAKATDVPFVEAEATEDLACDVDALIAAITPRTKVVLLANPNNPTGSHLRVADFERILAALPEHAILVMDEAYYEYAMAAGAEAEYPDTLRYLSAEQPRLMILRTFSKIYGLAGLRVGYGIGDARVIEYINRVRRPFNVNSIAQAAALAALDDTEHVRRSQEAARACIAELSEVVSKLGVRPYRSLGNFVLVGVGRDAGPVYEGLLREGVIVRPMGGPWGLPEHLRISVGTPEQTARVAAALRAVLS